MRTACYNCIPNTVFLRTGRPKSTPGDDKNTAFPLFETPWSIPTPDFFQYTIGFGPSALSFTGNTPTALFS